MSRINIYAEIASEWPLTSLQCFAGNVCDSCALPRTAESCQTIQGTEPLMPEATHVRLMRGALQLPHQKQGGTEISEGPGAYHGLSYPQLLHRGGREQQLSVLPPDPKHFAEQNAPLRISHAACPALARDLHAAREFLGRQTTYCQLNASRLCKVAQAVMLELQASRNAQLPGKTGQEQSCAVNFAVACAQSFLHISRSHRCSYRASDSRYLRCDKQIPSCCCNTIKLTCASSYRIVSLGTN